MVTKKAARRVKYRRTANVFESTLSAAISFCRRILWLRELAPVPWDGTWESCGQDRYRLPYVSPFKMVLNDEHSMFA